MRHIILISGKDSLATAIVQIARDPLLPYELVHNDVGWDLPETLAWIVRVGEHFGREIIRVGDDLTAVTYEQGCLPYFGRRFCTRLAKIKPVTDWLGTTPATIYYGLRADEPDRVGYQPIPGDVITPSFPLRELGIGLVEVWEIVSKAGLLPPQFRWHWMEERVRSLLGDDQFLLDNLEPWRQSELLAWRSRSNCAFCFYARQYEIVGLYEHCLEMFELGNRLERDLGHKGFTFKPGHSMPHLVARSAVIKEKRAKAVVKYLRTKQVRFLWDDDESPDELTTTSCGLLCGK
jgi:hypothetical protein